ncbi:ABC transporter ATP-binding protein [Planosporangium thailandense]|uniref:ABC transporter ATP-binding protein n=1 Tax=Planosporangium thailandense TaxID=765197 RepID=A0ABX0XYR0_9ACTN|nr:ABC transporter ATP-binding protein [Planosporangium thailandense]NJC71166.1 ABC transporter ATP-binding protein [Planosporangium thailandense]
MALPSSPDDHHYHGEHPLRTLAYLLRGDRARLALGTVAFFVKHSPTWLLPLVTANVIDIVVTHQPIVRLWLNCGLLLGLLLLNFPGHLLYVRCVSRAVRRMSTTMRSALCRRLQELSIGYHARVSSGALQAKVIRDVETVEQALQQSADNGLAALASLSGGLVVIAVRAPLFLPAFLIVVPAAAVLVMRLRGRLRSNNESFRREVEQLSSRVVEMTALIPITRAHGLEQDAIRRVDTTLRRVLHAGLRLDLLNGRFGALSWITLNTLGVGCLATAAWIAYTGAFGVTAGDVVMLSAFFATLTGSMTALMSLAPVISKGLESLRSVGEVLRAPDIEDNAGKAEVTRVRGCFEFQAVAYGYPDAAQTAVEELTFAVAPGETVALVGSSGAGKSTVLNLVVGFLRPSAGRILLDGVDMQTLDLRSYRRFISIVPQESILFDGTVRENVAYGLDTASERDILDALRQAHALEFIERLPHGLDTVVGERGARLSGGQKQRLAIARALIRDPRVLILDEATSALDTRSETLVQDALSRLMRGRTTFVVAHRLSTIRGADRILVLDNGRVVEAGTHEELLRAGGAYAGLQGVRAS